MYYRYLFVVKIAEIPLRFLETGGYILQISGPVDRTSAAETVDSG